MKCPICETPMKKDKRELQKGIFALVKVCPRCEDEWIDEKGTISSINDPASSQHHMRTETIQIPLNQPLLLSRP